VPAGARQEPTAETAIRVDGMTGGADAVHGRRPAITSLFDPLRPRRENRADAAPR